MCAPSTSRDNERRPMRAQPRGAFDLPRLGLSHRLSHVDINLGVRTRQDVVVVRLTSGTHCTNGLTDSTTRGRGRARRVEVGLR